MTHTKKLWLVAAGLLLILGTGSYVTYTGVVTLRTVGWRNLLPAQVIIMQGESMLPTIRQGDRLVFRKYASSDAGLQPGEIVLFSDPSKPDRLLIKRVIAVGGDVISIKNEVVVVNGQALQEPYVLKDGPAVAFDMPEQKVLPGAIFVMGDNRGRSLDSRMFGAVPLEYVRGSATSGLPAEKERCRPCLWQGRHC